MIIDASAIVAIMAEEPEGVGLTGRLDGAATRLTHPISVYEAALALARLNRVPTEVGRNDVDIFLQISAVSVLALDGAIASAALDAFSRYGRGRHPARLNMGDCFSYACAKLRGMPLLYKGDDFALTDLA